MVTEGYQLGVRIVTEPHLPNPYPEPVDDGSWEDDGGYVAKPNHQVWAMQFSVPFFYDTSRPEHVIICHPLTYAEYEHVLNRQFDKRITRVSNGQQSSK